MNVIKADSRFKIYNEDLETFKYLPAGTYNISFNPMEGFSLVSRPNLEVKERKIYGNSPAKIEKIMKSYVASSRNFGVMLSGEKGVGKSMFVRLLSQRMVRQGLPVIIVTNAIPGIASFIGSIEQECAVIFDEFEKTFSDENNEQDQLLSLFDGMDGGHKLFVVTFNEVGKVSQFMLNRPGRFHYHLTIGAPSSEEVAEYMKDNLKPEYHGYIREVVNLALIGRMPYDYLRAIAFELNQGYTLKEAMADLNITRDANRFDIEVLLSNGMVYRAYDEYMDISSRDRDRYYVRKDYENKDADAPQAFYIDFAACDMEAKDGILIVSKNVSHGSFSDGLETRDKEVIRQFNEKWKDVSVAGVYLKKSYVSNVARYTV